jgi:hypothetical protein
MTKKYGVRYLAAENLTDAWIAEKPDTRKSFQNDADYSLSVLIKNNQNLLLPEKDLTDIILTIAEQATNERLELVLRRLVQKRKCRTLTQNGDDYYYIKGSDIRND